VVEQGTHKPLVGSPNLPLGTKKDIKVLLYVVVSIQMRPPFVIYGGLKTGDFNVYSKNARPGAYHNFPAGLLANFG
jgi:hypothetical protein